jgi:hypothetical protein
VESVRLTAAGHYIDLRYRITDVERARELFAPKIRTVLVDEASGATMVVPETAKLGALRQLARDPKEGRNYFVLFMNQAAIHPGSKVKAVFGEFEFPGLTVE